MEDKTMSQNENNVINFPSNQPAQQQIEIEDLTYRLEEMSEAMDMSIANANNVAKEQMLLVEVIKASDKADKFKDFIESCEKQIESLKAQATALAMRTALLKQVVTKCKADENISKAVSMLLEALGVFKQH